MTTRYTKTIRILAAWSILAMILACGSIEEEQTTEEATEEAVGSAVEEAFGAGGGGTATPTETGGGGACDRIADCCAGYVEQMGAAAQASVCDNYNNVENMQDSMCQSAIDGWRAGLQAMSKTVPDACRAN